jgi:hypothetical protein
MVRNLSAMRRCWKPAVALILATPFLTELLSGSLPASRFFQPQVLLFLATVGYGFPVLLLREFAVRRQFGLASLFVVGLVYGIFNEGIIAKTFYLAKNVPINTFDGYGYAFGVAIPWAITISIWHALHSFIYPLFAVSYFFPEHRRSPWLNRPAIVLLAALTIAIGTLMFFHRDKDRPPGDAAHFILMIALVSLLLWLSTRLKSPSDSGSRHKETPSRIGVRTSKFGSRAVFLGGLAFVSLVVVPLLLAGAKVSLYAFHAYTIGLVALILWLINRRASLSVNDVLLFALGDDTLMALVGLATAIGAGMTQRIVTNALFLVLFVWVFLRLRSAAIAASRQSAAE